MPRSRYGSPNSPAPPFPSHPIIHRTQSQWLFSPAELARAPSILDGYDLVQEHANRAKGVNFITQVGILLKLPQLTLATASIYLHRFFMRYSMVDLPNRPGLHYYAIAATSLFLATKVEENCRKMKELVVACCRVAQKAPNLLVDEQSKEFWRWRDTILHNEDLLLEALCFDLQLEQPYRILFDFLCYYGAHENKKLRNAAWAFVNDSHLTVMCLSFSARTIAASALYAAAKHTNVAFPDDELGRPWWQHLGVEIGEMKRACNQMAEAYNNGRLPKHPEQSAYVVTPEQNAEETIKTRIMSTPNPKPSQEPSPAPSGGSESQGRKRQRDAHEEENCGIDQTGHHNGRASPQSTAEGPGQQSRSPKRPKVEPAATNGHLHPLPLSVGQTNGRPPSSRKSSTDDIQSRIDSIINSNSTSQPSSRQPHQLPPPLSRQSSSSSYAVSQNTSFPPQHPPPSSQQRSQPASQNSRVPIAYHQQQHRHRSRSRSPPHRDRERDRGPRERDTYIGSAGRERGITATDPYPGRRRSPSRGSNGVGHDGYGNRYDERDRRRGSWDRDKERNGYDERRRGSTASRGSRRSEMSYGSRPQSSSQNRNRDWEERAERRGSRDEHAKPPPDEEEGAGSEEGEV